MQVRTLLALVFMFLPVPLSAVPAQEAAAVAEPGPQDAEFERLFGEWKELLAELGALQIEYRDADDGQRAEIRKKWAQLIAKGDAMEPQLVSAAEKAYAQAPNADKRITNLLVDVLIGHVESRSFKMQTDDYDAALRIGRLLIENKCEDKHLYNAAGIAAFAVGDFDTAEKYLKLAEQQKSINEMGESFLANVPKYKDAWTKEKELRDAEAKADDLPRVLLETNKGDIELELFENQAPNAVANFISLVEKGYYDGLAFHRVLPGFMAQGGCPTGDGTGGPGYKIPCECYRPDRRLHFRGSLSMAHAGRDTGGSQFFITFLPTGHLDNPPPGSDPHTVFGRVVKGLEVLCKLQRRSPPPPGSGQVAPPPDKIIEAKVLRKRPHEYVPKKVDE